MLFLQLQLPLTYSGKSVISSTSESNIHIEPPTFFGNPLVVFRFCPMTYMSLPISPNLM